MRGVAARGVSSLGGEATSALSRRGEAKDERQRERQRGKERCSDWLKKERQDAENALGPSGVGRGPSSARQVTFSQSVSPFFLSLSQRLAQAMSFSFKIQRPEQQRAQSPLGRPASSSSRPAPASNRPRAWHGDDSDSDTDAPPRKDELVTGFDASGGLKSKSDDGPKQDRSLVIASIPNRDWREAATARGGGKKRKKERYIPDAVGGMKAGGQGVPAAKGDEKSQGGMGTRDVINDSVVVGGLEVAKKSTTTTEVEMDVDGEGATTVVAVVEEEESTTTAGFLPSVPPETEEERAIRELIAGEQVHAPVELSVIFPSAGDSRTAPLDEADAFRRDLLTRPDESTLDDYARVPVGQFGAALLRGMGWKEGTAASRTGRKGPTEAFVPTSRPALLGIGAKPITDVLGEEKGKNGKPVRKDRRDEMKFVPLVKRERDGGPSAATGSGKSVSRPSFLVGFDRSVLSRAVDPPLQTPAAIGNGTPVSPPASSSRSRRPSPPSRPSNGEDRDSDRPRTEDRHRPRNSDRDADREQDRGSKRPRSRDRGEYSHRSERGDRDKERRREGSRSPQRRRERSRSPNDRRHRDERHGSERRDRR